MTANSAFSRNVSFEIVEELGVIATHSTGWKKELNLVSWNGGQPKYDIRDWDPAHEHMSRGVTLHEREMRLIFDLLQRRHGANRNRRYGNGDDTGTAAQAAEDIVPASALPPDPGASAPEPPTHSGDGGF